MPRTTAQPSLPRTSSLVGLGALLASLTGCDLAFGIDATQVSCPATYLPIAGSYFRVEETTLSWGASEQLCEQDHSVCECDAYAPGTLLP